MNMSNRQTNCSSDIRAIPVIRGKLFFSSPMTSLSNSTILPPSVKTDFIGGHFRSFRGDPTGFLTRLAKLGDVAYFRMASQPAFFVNDPELIRDVLVVNADKFIKGRALQRAKTLLGNGLLTSEDEFHLGQRRMIQPAFHKMRIAEYARSMVEYAERLSAEWKDGEVRDIDKEMMRLTLRIVAKTLFSADITDEADEVGQAMTTLVEMFNYLLLPFAHLLEKLPLPQTRRLNQARGTLNDIIFQFINERRRSGEDKGDLLSMLLSARDENDGSAMSDEQIRDEALTLFLAGHETTANAMTWTCYLLSQNPAAEEKLHEELDHVFGSDIERSPSIEDIPNLKYTEAVIAESMRLFPPAWAIGRLAIEDHRFGQYAVPKGSLVLVSPYVTHRDPRFWDESEKFVPERWLTTPVKEMSQQFRYFPFGGGVRRCVGESFAWAEGILLLATLARQWKLELVPEQKIGLQPMITLRPKFGMKMFLRSRP
jgi:cytochrome P450